MCSATGYPVAKGPTYPHREIDADQLTRREFITLIGGAAVAWPGVTRAQRQPMPVIGYLRSGSRAASSQVEAAFRQGLSSMGFIEGRNVAIDYQYAENQNDRLIRMSHSRGQKTASA